MRTTPWQRVCTLGLLISLLSACGIQAPLYAQLAGPDDTDESLDRGHHEGTETPADEAAVYQELGTPDTIRFFRAVQTRQRVYEWIYTEKQQVVWFVDRQRVEYVAVDTDTSGQPKNPAKISNRSSLREGLLGAVVGGFAAGMLVLGESLGLKD